MDFFFRASFELSLIHISGLRASDSGQSQGENTRHCSHTVWDGSAYHQYQPLTKKGNADIGSGFNDDPLWLIAAAALCLSLIHIYKNMFVKNVVVDYSDRPAGSESKLNTISDGIRVVRMMLRLFRNYKPLAFFGIVAALLLALAAAVFVPVVWMPYLQTGLVPNFPTLIVCGFVVLAALLCYATGLVLDTMVQKEKQEFEFRLQLVQLQKTRADVAGEERRDA